jgi:hypothetical protein
MSIQDILDRCEDHITIHTDVPHTFIVCFSKKGFGFGQIHFFTDAEGNLCCENENMNKETLKEILGMMVDRCKLMDQ